MSNSIKDFLNCIDEDPKLTELIKGKRVCLCGPAKTNIGSGYGDYIDSFDTVCRVNWHLTGKDGWDPDLNCDFGKRTDVMFSGFIYKYTYYNIQKMKETGSLFNCFNDIKYSYFVDPVNLPEYQNYGGGYWFKQNSKRMFSSIESFEDEFKNLDIDFGIINCWLQRIENIKYFKSINYKINEQEVYTNSGVHTIQAILRHQPKELFITGMNFGNFGKGGLLKDLYADNGYSRENTGLSKFRIHHKVHIIHTKTYSLLFLKKIFDEYDNIELDKLLKKFFDNFKQYK